MKIQVDGCFGAYTLTNDEIATPQLCNELIHEAQTVHVLNIDICVPIGRLQVERVVLEAQGFRWCGTVSRGTPTQEVFALFRTCVRVSGDGVETYGNCTLAPTKEEAAAVEYTKQNFLKPLCESRLAYLESIGQQPAPESQPDLVIENMRAEIARMEAALKSEQEAKSKKQEEAEAPQPEAPKLEVDPDESENRRACVHWTPL